MHRTGKIVAGVAVALVVTAGLVAENRAEAGGHSLDPTDATNFNTYHLRNDGPVPLFVRRCADTACATFETPSEWAEVAPGDVDSEDVYWGPPTPLSFAVSTDAGRHSGGRCVRLATATKNAAPVELRLSAAVRCSP